MNALHKIFSSKARGAVMAETAITLPVTLVLTFALINFALVGYAATAAANAANYGARIGSVVQSGAAGSAATAANAALKTTMIGSYQVAAGGGGRRGATVTVSVNWTVPNWFGSIASLVGASTPGEFKGTARSTFRQEGW